MNKSLCTTKRWLRSIAHLLIALVASSTALAQIQIAVSSPASATSAPGVAAGSNITFAITNAQVGTQFPMVITKPASYLYVAGSANNGWVCSSTGGPISCSGGTVNNFTFALSTPSESTFSDPILAPDASGQVSVDQSGGSSNVLSFYSVRSDIVIQPPTVAPLAVGNQVAMTFNVLNGGPGAPLNRFTQTRVLFSLPPDLSYVSQSTVNAWSCTGAGSNVSCTTNQTASTPTPITLPIGLLIRRNTAPAGSSQIAYSVGTPTNDPNSANNTGNVLVPLQLPPSVDLRISSTPVGAQTSGGTLSADFRVSAISGSANNVEVRFSQSGAAAMQIQSATAFSGGFVCSVDSQGLSANCAGAQLAQGAFVDLRIIATLPIVPLAQTQSLVLRGEVTSSTSETNPSDNVSNLAISVDGPPAAQLQLSKTVSTSQVSTGQEFTYALSVNNTSAVAATSLQLNDDLDSRLSPIALEQPSAGLSCALSGNQVSCNKSSLAVGEQARVTIRVRAPNSVGSIPNTARANALNTLSEQTASVSVLVGAGVDLVLDKSDSADPVNVGSEFEYILSVSNRGTSAATNVSLVDDLPASVSFVSANGSGFSCSGGQNLRCTLTTLAANATASVRVLVRASTAGFANNVATVSAAELDASIANNTDSESTSLQSVASVIDAAITAPSAQSVNVGNDGVINYTINSIGNTPATCGLALTLANPNAAFVLKSVASTGASCSVNGNSANCQLPSIAAGGQTQVQATVGALLASSATLNASISCPNDIQLSNNISSTVLTGQLSPGADLTIQVRDDDPVPLLAEFGYQVTLNNLGPESAPNTRVIATLPTGVDYLSFNGAGVACTAAGQSVTCTLNNALAPASTLVFTLRARASGESGAVSASFDVASTARDPNFANNSVRVDTQINPKDAEQVVGVITPQLTDQFARDAAPVVADICANPIAELKGQCEAIVDAALDRDIGALQSGLRAIFPEEVLAQRLALVQQSDTQFNNIDTRMSELRTGGGSGLSLSGLNLQFGKTFVPMGLVQAVMDGDEEPEVGGSGDLISPWGFFVNGTYSRGTQNSSSDLRELGTDFDNIGVTGGVDYRLSARTVLGAALGYSKFDSDLADDSSTRSKTLSLTGYGSHYFTDQFYADARFTFGNASFDTVRRIRFNYQGFSIDKTAFGSTDARQYAFGAGFGYHFQKDAWSITPNANFRYFRSTVDGYTESGAGANSVIFGDQTVDSVQYNIGLQISRAISLSHGILAPQFDLSYGHETKNADFALGARLLGATAGSQGFVVRAEDADKSFGNIGIGFVYVTSNGKQAYLNYRRLFADDSIDRDTINLGARFEF